VEKREYKRQVQKKEPHKIKEQNKKIIKNRSARIYCVLGALDAGLV
jgi:predicted negative regulator of RcsB-dependent stress response